MTPEDTIGENAEEIQMYHYKEMATEEWHNRNDATDQGGDMAPINIHVKIA